MKLPQLIAVITVVFVTLNQSQTITDPGTDHPSYLTQGEFLGRFETGDYVGIQVKALKDGEFSAVFYSGGLPGQGWMPGMTFTALSGASIDESEVFFSGASDSVKLQGDIISGRITQGNFTGKRIYRFSPSLGIPPPTDAVVLFDSSLARESLITHWKEWILLDSLLRGTVTTTRMKSHFLHLEFRTPFQPGLSGQKRGNSGVYIHGRHEIQILDSFGQANLSDGDAGSIYDFKAADVNMSLPPLTWQTYDIQADWVQDKPEEVMLTIYYNGRKIHDRVISPGTPGGKESVTASGGPLFLQEHKTPVVFNNIWFVENRQVAVAELSESPEDIPLSGPQIQGSPGIRHATSRALPLNAFSRGFGFLPYGRSQSILINGSIKLEKNY